MLSKDIVTFSPTQSSFTTVLAMAKIKDLMSTGVISVEPDDSVEKAIRLMIKHRLSGLPVTDSTGRLLGLISEFDLLELVWDPQTGQDRVYQYMTREVKQIDQDAELATAAESFRTLSIRRLPVTRDGQVVGIISRHDLLRYVMQARGQVAPVVPSLLSPVEPAVSGAATP